MFVCAPPMVNVDHRGFLSDCRVFCVVPRGVSASPSIIAFPPDKFGQKIHREKIWTLDFLDFPCTFPLLSLPFPLNTLRNPDPEGKLVFLLSNVWGVMSSLQLCGGSASCLQRLL